MDIRQLRHVGQHQPLIRQQPRGHQRQRGVLRPTDGDFPGQRPAATNTNTIHLAYPILGRATPRWRMYFPALSA